MVFRTMSILAATAVLLSVSCGGPSIPSPSERATPNAAAAELELSGVYNVEGADTNKSDPYKGLLTVTNQEDVYKFEWQTNRSRHNGVGVQMGDAVAATYAMSGDGKGCGVALYRIAPDGSLDGSIASWGEYTFGTEKAERVEGTTFEGKYKVTGTTNDGKPYGGSLAVKKNGGGYQFTWNTGDKEFFGFGVWRGDRAAISFGGHHCYFAIYKVESARSLEGFWGSQRNVEFGTENAKRQ